MRAASISTMLCLLLGLAVLPQIGCVAEEEVAAEEAPDITSETTETTNQEVQSWRAICWGVTAFYSIWWEHIDNFHRGTTVYEYYKVNISGVHWSHIITHGGRVGWVRTAALC